MRESTRDRLFAAVPSLVFAALYALTWKRWIFPFQDHGRELMIPSRLLDGEALYRDAAWFYGPLPPYLDALAMKLVGRSLDAVIAVRLLFALAGVEALRRLARRLTGEFLASGAVAGFVVAACAFGYGGAWAFPYSGAALEGAVGTWWALELALGSESLAASLGAALVAGLAGGAKVEVAPVAIAAVALGLLGRRPLRESAAAVAGAAALVAAAWGLPVLLFGSPILSRQGYLIALHEPSPWRAIHDMVLWGGLAPQDFLGGYLLALAPSVAFLGGALCLLIAATRRGPERATLAASFAFGLLSAAVPRNDELIALLPLAAAWVLLAAWRPWRGGPRAPGALPIALAVGGPMLLALWRQPFFLRIPAYGAFAAPLALAMALAWPVRRKWVAPSLAAAFALGLLSAQALDRVRERRAIPMTWVSLPHASLYVPAPAAPVLLGTVAMIERLTPPRSWVAGFPETGLALFVTGRRSPFADEQFYPGHQDAAGEEEMIRRLDTRPLSAAIVTNQPLAAFESGEYRHGVLDRFFRAFDARMRPALVVGDPNARIRYLGTATAVTVYLPRERRP